MTDATLDARVRRVIEDLFGAHDVELTDGTAPAEIPGWDSLGNVNVMFGLEQEFNVRFSDEDFAPVDTIGHLKERLRRHGVS